MVAEITRVSVKRAHLLTGGLDDFRMAVSDVGHIVIGVEIASTSVVKQILYLAPNDFQWIRVSQRQVTAGDL